TAPSGSRTRGRGRWPRSRSLQRSWSLSVGPTRGRGPDERIDRRPPGVDLKKAPERGHGRAAEVEGPPVTGRTGAPRGARSGDAARSRPGGRSESGGTMTGGDAQSAEGEAVPEAGGGHARGAPRRGRRP